MSLKKADLAQATKLLRKILAVILAAPVGATKATGADLFQKVGSLSANAEIAVATANLGKALLGCFEGAYAAGATLVTIGQVRSTIMAEPASSAAAVAVQQAALRMVLLQESKILSKTPLTSRRDVDAYIARMNAAFEPAESFAADAHDADTYRALVSLHAAVSQDLATRGRPLPRLVPYSFPVPMPALSLSQRLYSDGSRAAELINENRPFHPLFCPRQGIALSA